MRAHFWTIVVALLLCASTAVAAKMYKWVDDKGNVYYSDRVPPDQVKQGRQQLNAQGVAVEQVQRARTPEEIAAAKAKAAEAARVQAEADKIKRADDALLNSYAEEGDLKRNFDARVELLEQQIQSAEADIKIRQNNLDALVAVAARDEQSGKKVAPAVTTMIDDSRKVIEQQRALIVEKTKDRSGAQANYDEQLRLYREALARRKAKAEVFKE